MFTESTSSTFLFINGFIFPASYVSQVLWFSRYKSFYARMALGFQILYSNGFSAPRSISWCFLTNLFLVSNLSRVLCFQYLWSNNLRTQSSQDLMFPMLYIFVPIFLTSYESRVLCLENHILFTTSSDSQAPCL